MALSLCNRVPMLIVIATTVVEWSHSRNVVAIGKDTDLLILLIHNYSY